MSGLASFKTAGAIVLLTCGAIATGSSPTAAQSVRYRIVPEESEARYRVRERLARLEFPNDAVGVTQAITGQLTLTDGAVVEEESSFVIDLRTLKSDKDRRDSYLQRNTLETAEYPLMTFVPTALDGLPHPVPTSGTHMFRLLGQATLHGVTQEVVWEVELEFSPEGAMGSASTHFSFDTFNMTIPRMAALLSVTDDIRLELDLVLAPIAEAH